MSIVFILEHSVVGSCYYKHLFGHAGDVTDRCLSLPASAGRFVTKDTV